MVLAKVVQWLIKSTLGQYAEYITGLETLELGYWSGVVELNNLSFKPELADILKLPFKFHFSNIKKVRAVIPWDSPTEKPTQISIEGVYIIISPKTQSDLEKIHVNIFEQKHKLAESFKETLESNIKDLAQQTKPEDHGWLET